MGGGMNNEDIIRMARDAGCEIRNGHAYNPHTGSLDQMLKRFAALVIANNPPQTFMSYQEGYAAGVAAERNACLTEFMFGRTTAEIKSAIRARGQA